MEYGADHAAFTEQSMDYADQHKYLCVQHIVELYAKLIEESSRVLTTVMHHFGHIQVLKDELELLKERLANLKHVKQVARAANKHLQAAASLRPDRCCPAAPGLPRHALVRKEKQPKGQQRLPVQD